MSARVVSALALLLAFISLIGAPTAQSTDVLPAALIAKAAAGETISVIVGVAVSAAPLDSAMGQAAFLERQNDVQLSVEPVVAALSAIGVRAKQRFDNFAAFSADVDAAGLALLAAMPQVTSVSESVSLFPTVSDSVPLIRAPEAWRGGADGRGWVVAVLDTGIDKTHPFLSGKVVMEGCASGGALPTNPLADRQRLGVSLCPRAGQNGFANVQWGSGTGGPHGQGADSAHGTHVAGIVAGGAGGAQSGVAPGAQLMSIQVFRQGITAAQCGAGQIPCTYAATESVLAAMDKVATAHFLDFDEHVAAINLSLGTQRSDRNTLNIFNNRLDCDSFVRPMTIGIAQLRGLGIATVIASGQPPPAAPGPGSNFGIAWPACITGAIAVGATTKEDVMWARTHRSPLLSLLAPGVGIVSSVPGGGMEAMSGTSMAAPHVSGAWAVLKQARPDLTVRQIFDALFSTGRRIDDTLSFGTYHRIDLGAAWGSVTRVVVPPGPVPPGPTTPGRPGTPTATVTGGVLTVSWTAPASGASPTSHRLDFYSNGTLVTSVTVGAGVSTSIAIPPGTVGTFSVAVTAIAGGTSGPPSAGITFTIGGGPGPGPGPAPPGPGPAPGPGPCSSPPAPPPGLTGTLVNGVATVSWNLSAGATSYIVRAGSTSGASNLHDANVGATTTVSASGLPANFRAYIRVLAVNGCGVSLPTADFLLGGSSAQTDMQITMTWDTVADMDLHVIEPDGTHVYYGARNGRTVRLENDDADGFGPEHAVVNRGAAAAGTYRVYITHFRGQPTTTTIEIRLHAGTSNERVQTFTRDSFTASSTLGYNVADVNILTGQMTERTGTQATDAHELPGGIRKAP